MVALRVRTARGAPTSSMGKDSGAVQKIRSCHFLGELLRWAPPAYPSEVHAHTPLCPLCPLKPPSIAPPPGSSSASSTPRQSFAVSKDGNALLNEPSARSALVPALVELLGQPADEAFTLAACENAAATLEGRILGTLGGCQQPAGLCCWALDSGPCWAHSAPGLPAPVLAGTAGTWPAVSGTTAVQGPLLLQPNLQRMFRS